MLCKICGGAYINLGVHVKKKHMNCDDYRRMFDIPLTTPLAEKSLCDQLSVSALQRLEDPEWLAQCSANCAANSADNKGKKIGVRNLPKASKKALIDRNKETGECYRNRMIPAILGDYMGGMTPIEIQRKHGVSPCTQKDWQKLGLLPKRRLQYAFETPNAE